jgi:hypothetical protein
MNTPDNEELSWSGFSSREYHSQSGRIPELCRPDPRLAGLPLFAPVLACLQHRSADEIERLQALLLDRTDHRVALSIYLGVLGREAARRLRHDVGLALRALIGLCRLLAAPESEGAAFAQLCAHLKARRPDMLPRFLTVLHTSRFHYQHFAPAANLGRLLDSLPLFVECGVDWMLGAAGPILAEFQLGCQTYPDALAIAERACADLLPNLFAEHRVESDDYPRRRRDLLVAARDRFVAGTAREQTRGIVIDAWARLAHRGGHHRPLAEELGMDYLLFDDLARGRPPFDGARTTVEKLFVFNQPPVYLLDPDDDYFRCFNSMGLEGYPPLAWPGLLREHLRGRVMFTSAPWTDILNDKALYVFIPLLVEFFLGESLALPVIDTRELWDREDPGRLDRSLFAWVRENKDGCVLAHRYLEGGMGIRVGKYLAQSEWDRFLAKVARHPDHFVVRSYYPMDPVHSLRLLAAALVEGGNLAASRVEISRACYGRMSLTGAVDNIAASGHAFLTVASDSESYSNTFELAAERGQAGRPGQRPAPLPR